MRSLRRRVVPAVSRASKKYGFWRSVERLLSRPRSRMAEVNVGKIAALTKSGDKVVVPGKVLGKGDIEHSVTVAALSFSSTALSKLRAAGCIVMGIDELAKTEPRGSGVKVIV